MEVKCKYQRGRLVEGQWVLGGICRETRQVFLVPVDNRDGATLLSIIEEYVAPKTHIVSDCWKGYDSLQQSSKNYTHSTVNHSQNFVGKYNSLTLALALALTLALILSLSLTLTLALTLTITLALTLSLTLALTLALILSLSLTLALTLALTLTLSLTQALALTLTLSLNPNPNP